MPQLWSVDRWSSQPGQQLWEAGHLTRQQFIRHCNQKIHHHHQDLRSIIEV